MKEASLYGPLVDGADVEDWLLYRIADGSAGYKPFDIGGADHYGIAVGLEVKVTAETLEAAAMKPLPWRLFEPRQRAWLNEFGGHRCLALIGLYYEPIRAMRVYRLAGQPDEAPRSCYDIGGLEFGRDLFRGWKKLAIARGKFGVPKRIKHG